MRYAFFPGCLAQTELYGYDLSAREVLPRLGVELEELEGKSCCGYPSYGVTSPLIWTYLSARNMALAEQRGLDILTLCNNCNLSFCQNKAKLEKDEGLAKVINDRLSDEGMTYDGKAGIVDLLEVLYDRIGVDGIAGRVVKPLDGLRLAPHPGCHSFRPSSLERPDGGEKPVKLIGLIRALGAEAVEFPGWLDCCGASAVFSERETGLRIAGRKLEAVKENRLDALVTSCPHCFKVFDGHQESVQELLDEELGVPVVLYTQILGLALGIQPGKLGLGLNLSPVEGLLHHF